MEWLHTFFKNVGLFVTGILIGIVILFLSDRSPPVTVHGYSLSDASYHVGEPLKIDWNLERDITRDCDCTIYSEVIDSEGNKYSYETQHIPSELLKVRGKSSPGISKVVRQIPYNLSSGIAHYHVVLEYKCNPTHSLWPIRVPLTAQFVID